jgi:hypothetical protein
VVYVVNVYPAAGNPFNLLASRSVYIIPVTISVNVIQVPGIAVDNHHPGAGYTISDDTGPHQVNFGHKAPLVNRDVIAADAHARRQRRPAIIAAAIAPADPGRPPLLVGNPGPAIIIIVEPAAIMKRSPAPFIIRHPGVAIFGYHPMPCRGIRLEVRAGIGNPHVPIASVLHPSAIGLQFVIKSLVRSPGPRLGHGPSGAQEYHQGQQPWYPKGF